jgi:hypothetical protein
MRPINGSGVSGAATFRGVDDGVAVKLALHYLPKPHTFYLAHVHPGTCAQGEAQREEEETPEAQGGLLPSSLLVMGMDGIVLATLEQGSTLFTQV